ncbi:hypothetical protein RhiirB3_527782 [Rhizophagus irregularis]|nr:hypothetical protein RhiirB3_527782 [Rhizophagus irregularis]
MRTIFSYTSTSVAQWNNFTAEHALKAAILSAAIATLPFCKVSNTYRHSYSPELTKLIAINKFLDRLLYRLTTRHPNRPSQISQMITALPSHLKNLASLLPDYSVPNFSTTFVSEFKSFLRSQKNLVSAFLSTKFAQHLTDSVEYYTALRDEHFSNSLNTFIDSALLVEKHSMTSCRNSSCGLLVPPKAVLAGFLGFSEQFLWTSWTTSWLSGEDFS